MSAKENEAFADQGVPPPYHDHSVGEDDFSKKQMPPPAYSQPQQYPGQAQGAYPGANPQAQPMVLQPSNYTAPGQVVVVVNPAMPNAPPTHLNYAIFVTLCCCWPIGIFAILRSASCKSAIAQGDRMEAERLSKEAKKLSMWALVIGIIFNVVSFAAVIAVYALYVIPSLQGETHW